MGESLEEQRAAEAARTADPTAVTHAPEDLKNVTFTVGETLYPGNLEATFRVITVGRNGLGITLTSSKPIVPKDPYLVRFKGILFKVSGWHGRDFNLLRVLEE